MQWKISIFSYCSLFSFFILVYFITIVLIFPLCSPLSRHPTPLPQSIPTLLSTSVGHSYMFFVQSLPLLSTITPLPNPLFPLAAVSLFSVPVYLVLFCSLVYFVHWIPLISEIIWYLSFTNWLISLIIIVSSSLHDVAKGRNSFFFLWAA